jgi:hypothetical protein
MKVTELRAELEVIYIFKIFSLRILWIIYIRKEAQKLKVI